VLEGKIGDRSRRKPGSVAGGIRCGSRERRSRGVVNESVNHPVAYQERYTFGAPFRQRISCADPADQRLVQIRQTLGQRPVLDIRSSLEGVQRFRPGEREIELQAMGEPLVRRQLERVVPSAAEGRVDQTDRGEL